MKKFKLDTNNSGNDEILEGENYDDVLFDVLNFHEISELPNDWEITEIDY